MKLQRNVGSLLNGFRDRQLRFHNCLKSISHTRRSTSEDLKPTDPPPGNKNLRDLQQVFPPSGSSSHLALSSSSHPTGKKCTYGVKCKFYHPERLHQSQLSVADELRAQSDRTRSFSPKPSIQETHCGLQTSSPLAPAPEDKPLRSSPSQRDRQKQRQQSSLEADEAFGSLEGSLSRLYLQEAPYSRDSYSSGVASYGSEGHSLSGSFSGYGARGPADGASCCSCSRRHPQVHPLHHQAANQQPWVSCPALPQLNGSSYSDMQYFVPPAGSRQGHSLPRDPWGHDQCCRHAVPVQMFAGEPSSSSSRRRGLRSQLGALFPQSTVERLLDTYPNVSDMSELMRLIQNNWTRDMSF